MIVWRTVVHANPSGSPREIQLAQCFIRTIIPCGASIGALAAHRNAGRAKLRAATTSKCFHTLHRPIFHFSSLVKLR